MKNSYFSFKKLKDYFNEKLKTVKSLSNAEVTKRTNRTALAEELARKKHKGQLYDNQDYFETHLKPVAELTKIRGKEWFNKGLISEEELERAVIVAYLHDIVEDTDINIDTIKELFGETISNEVYLLTKKDGKSDSEYYDSIVTSRVAELVKTADRLFNISYISIIGKKDRTQALKFLNKYENSLKYMKQYTDYKNLEEEIIKQKNLLF